MRGEKLYDWCLKNTCRGKLLIDEWHTDKNGAIEDSLITAHNNKKVWWRCSLGHEWMAAVSSRTDGIGCPQCARAQTSSFPEQAIFYYIKLMYSDAINGDRHLNRELDIYIPSIKVAIEYDGQRWHGSKNAIANDILKNQICEDNAIKLIRVREPKCPKESDGKSCIRLDSLSEKSLEEAIQLLSNLLGKNIDVNLERDNTVILQMISTKEQVESLYKLFPELLDEWNYERNAGIDPNKINAHSHRKVWWKCYKGHEWQAVVKNRTIAHSKCPYCSGNKLVKGENDIVSQNKDLANEWNYSKNGMISPHDVAYRSNKKYWWKCENGHTWLASPDSRSRGSGCPYCSNSTVLEGYNDLLTVFPEISKEWDFEKNIGISPTDLVAGSNIKVWWKCTECNFSWKASVSNRTGYNKSGCPKCAKKQAGAKLKYSREEFVFRAKKIYGERYDYSKVDYIDSQTKVIIVCPEHGEFLKTPNSHLRGQGCPKCAREYHAEQRRRTVSQFIEEAQNIHGDKYDYSEVEYVNSIKKVRIKCKEHGYFMQNPECHIQGQGCPICGRINASKKLKNDTKEFIKMAQEKHGDKYNYSKVDYKSATEKVVIICPIHGEFFQIASSHLRGSGCPKCGIEARKKERSSNKDIFIAKAKNVHGNKYNYDEVVYVNSATKVKIKCSLHGVFEQLPNNHLRGSICPMCANVQRVENLKRAREAINSK